MNILIRIISAIGFVCALFLLLKTKEIGVFAYLGGWLDIVFWVAMVIFIILQTISIIKYFNKKSLKNKKDKDS